MERIQSKGIDGLTKKVFDDIKRIDKSEYRGVRFHVLGEGDSHRVVGTRLADGYQVQFPFGIGQSMDIQESFSNFDVACSIQTSIIRQMNKVPIGDEDNS